MNLWQKVNRYYDGFLNACGVISGSIITLVTILTCVSVVMRYLIHKPLAWDIEVTGYCLLFTACMGTAWLLKEDGHIKVEIIFEKLSPRLKRLFLIIISSFCTLVGLVITWYATASTIDCLKRHALFSGSLGFPKAVIMGAIAFAFLTLTIETSRKILASLKSPGVR
jgi:C4-dicarboxylate transporter, DctQ subunit